VHVWREEGVVRVRTWWGEKIEATFNDKTIQLLV
jgi:hypothetical protein